MAINRLAQSILPWESVLVLYSKDMFQILLVALRTHEETCGVPEGYTSVSAALLAEGRAESYLRLCVPGPSIMSGGAGG